MRNKLAIFYLVLISLVLLRCGQTNVDYLTGVLGGSDNGYSNDIINFQNNNGGDNGGDQGNGNNYYNIVGTWKRYSAALGGTEYYTFNSDGTYEYYVKISGFSQTIHSGTYEVNNNTLILHTTTVGDITYTLSISGNTLYIEGQEYTRV